MHKTLRSLPSLDFLRGFEAAGARLSFTLRGRGAVSHPVGAVAPGQGARRRARRAAVRAAAPRTGAHACRRGVPPRGHGRCSDRSPQRRMRFAVRRAPPGLTVSTTVSFASLWIIPRLSRFSRAPPRRRGLRVGRRSHGRSGARRRRPRRALPAGCVPYPRARCDLFGERMLPVASPRSSARARRRLAQPLRSRAPRAAAPRRSRRPHAVAQLARMAHGERRSRA